MKQTWSLRYLLFCVGWSTFVLGALAAEQHDRWGASITYTFAHDGPSVVLANVDQDESHLTGTFLFENVSGPRQHAKDLILEGVETDDGQFWPTVHCEVLPKGEGEWNALGSSSMMGRPAKLAIKAESSVVELHVRLDSFQPLIGTYEVGRIVLGSGDTGEFAMSDIGPSWRVESR